MGKFFVASEDDLQGKLRVDLLVDERRLRGVVVPLIEKGLLRLAQAGSTYLTSCDCAHVGQHRIVASFLFHSIFWVNVTDCYH